MRICIKTATQRLGNGRNLVVLPGEVIVIQPSVFRAFRLVAPYLALNHQVVYRYSSKEVRTLFKNQFDSFHWLSCGEIERLCTIHVLGVDPREFLPAGGILRSGGHNAGSANKSSLESYRNTSRNDRRWED